MIPFTILAAFSGKKARTTWTVIAVVLLLIVLWANRRWFQRFFATDQGSFTGAMPDNARKAYLENLAREIHEGVNGNPLAWDYDAILGEANALNDNELRYLASFYSDTLREDLGDDIDGEWLWDTSEDERLLDRLRTLGLY